jgi:hypothetical protein
LRRVVEPAPKGPRLGGKHGSLERPQPEDVLELGDDSQSFALE